jgi:hypothetical protein
VLNCSINRDLPQYESKPFLARTGTIDIPSLNPVVPIEVHSVLPRPLARGQRRPRLTGSALPDCRAAGGWLEQV